MQTISISIDGKLKFVTHMISIHDDFKPSSDWRNINIFNAPLMDWMKKTNLTPSQVWPHLEDNERTLWNARLYSASDTPSGSLLDALHLYHNHRLQSSSQLLSIEQCLELADNNHLLNNLHIKLPSRLIAAKCADQFIKQINVTKWMNDAFDLDTFMNQVDHHIKKSSFTFSQSALERVRMLRSLDYQSSNHHQQINFKLKSQLMLRDLMLLSFIDKQDISSCTSNHPSHEILNYDLLTNQQLSYTFESNKNYDRCVHVNLPVRINLAGGWTDTPPYCLVEGGTVLNMAIKINHKNPVNAYARYIPEPCIRIKMIERSNTSQVEVIRASDLFTYDDPGSDFALHKAVICFLLFPKLCIIKNQRNICWENVHLHLKSGLEIVTEVTDVPHGSGLGTSSILILACLKAIKLLLKSDHIDFYDHLDYDKALLNEEDCAQVNLEFDAVMAIEQMLTTGGGWQDQIGGAISGIKLIQTQPLVSSGGNDYRIDRVKPKHDLRNRFIVIYTGKQRMAKMVLTNVVENYVIRVEETISALAQLKIVTKQMFDRFNGLSDGQPVDDDEEEALYKLIGELLSEVKRLNVCLSPETQNQMKHVFDALELYSHGSCMIGAGAGGFVVGIIKNEYRNRRDWVVSELQKVDDKLELC
ncbi:hypothetical protein AKO1_007931, partial [Acrasis kona]